MSNKLKKHLNGYARTPNEVVNSKEISLKAKGLYALIESKPEDWNFSVRGLASLTKEGVDSVASAIKELEVAGYIVRVKYQDNEGYWRVEYNLYESKVVRENPCTENPSKENPCKENTLNIQRKNNKEITTKKEQYITDVETSDEISKKYYQVIKKYDLPVLNHNTLRSKIKEMSGSESASTYLDFLLDYDYRQITLEFKPELNNALDVFSKRLKIINQIKQAQNKKPRYVSV